MNLVMGLPPRPTFLHHIPSVRVHAIARAEPSEPCGVILGHPADNVGGFDRLVTVDAFAEVHF